MLSFDNFFEFCHQNYHTAVAILKQFVTESGKTGLIHTSTDIYFLPVRESNTHALPRNTKHKTIDCQVFTDAVL